MVIQLKKLKLMERTDCTWDSHDGKIHLRFTFDLIKSGRYGFTRGGEHLMNKEQDENRSVLKLHANHHHGGADVRFTMKVTGLHSDSLGRQVTEGVNLATFSGDVLMNRRGELGGVVIE